MRAKDFDRDEFLSTTWPEALESGEFEQGKAKLRDVEGNYCCLGVACELLSRLKLLDYADWRPYLVLPAQATKLLGIKDAGQYMRPRAKYKKLGSLAGDNDKGQSFNRIAKTIRRLHKSDLFEKSVEDAS